MQFIAFFSYIFAIRKTPLQLKYDEKHDSKSKMSKNILKKVKNFFINAICAHSGPEYFLEHIVRLYRISDLAVRFVCDSFDFIFISGL